MSKAPRKALQADWDAVGGLSEPRKMPEYSYSIPAWRCNVGSKLRLVIGSTCSHCYALKGRYVFPNVADALERRYQAMVADYDAWADAMARLIDGLCQKHFRWMDAGDLQSLAHLLAIVSVARQTPATQHWLPTREYAIVKAYRAQYGEFPANLTVRLSAHMIDGMTPDYGLPTSTVTTSTTPEGSHACPARFQDGKCADCRACWTASVANVAYHVH